MRELIDGIIDGVHVFFFGDSSSLGLLSNVNYDKILFWIFIAFIIRLVIVRVLSDNSALRLAVHFVAALFFFVAASFIYKEKELLLISEAALFLTTFSGMYFFLLWLPIWFQYNPSADEKIKELLSKGVLTEEDNNELYKLRRQSSEAYDNNVKWLFKPRKVKHTEY